ncbi:MAG: hypothetical protein ACOY4H_14305 [Thermodesulfobacteriota bacterium]
MSTQQKKPPFSRRLLSLAAIAATSALTGCTPGANMPASTAGPAADRVAISQTTTALPLSRPQPGNPTFRYGEPLTGFTSANFVGASRCALCHGNLRDRDGNDMSINNHWRSTMMANAAKDPFWQAKVASETTRHPAIKKVIEEKCVSCHMPMAWTQFNAEKKNDDPATSAAPYEAFVDHDHGLHQAAMDGVSCSLCHQIRDHELGTPNSFSGKYTVDTAAIPPDRPAFGPYGETVAEPMQTSIGFTPLFGSHTNDSALCATCHTLYTPYLDGKGNIAGEFPEQTPYLEWLHSDFGLPTDRRRTIDETGGPERLCQDCHMPHSQSGGVMIALPAPKEATEKDHFSQHHFVGGNILLLNIMQDNLEALGISASTRRLEETKERTARLLQEQTAALTFRDGAITTDTLTVTVAVESKVGHKFPTGFPSRRAWLHFTVQDASGALVFESGRPDPDGRVTGDDGDEKMDYEPHHDLITSPDQVQIYESVMHDTDNKVTFTLLRAAGYIKDNRLLPRGFDKATADRDIAVQGEAAADPNFSGGGDQVTYAVPLGRTKGPYTVTAELLYTPISRAFMADLTRDRGVNEVDRFLDYYDKADKRPTAVAAVRGVIR